MPRRVQRLDAELVRRKLARSREHAVERISAGRVEVRGVRASKPATRKKRIPRPIRDAWTNVGSAIAMERAMHETSFFMMGSYAIAIQRMLRGVDGAGR